MTDSNTHRASRGFATGLRRVSRRLWLPLLLALGGCSASSGSGSAAPEGGPDPSQDPPIAVRVAPVVREPLSALYVTSATLRAERRATITARTRGVIRKLLVEEGDSVRERQPVAVLEDDEQRIEFERARTAVDTTGREYARAEELHAQGLVSEEEFEAIRRAAREAQHAADLAELRLARTRIHAPFAGRILERHVDVGATVSDGDAVYELADLDPLYADVPVPERQIARLAPGRAVRLGTDASGEQARGEIERVAPRVDPTSGTVKVTLGVRGSTSLRPGSFVRVEIVTDTHEQALVVPRSALVVEGRRSFVFRVTSVGDAVERLEVRPGLEERDRVEILEGSDVELAVGDRVVVVGASALTDGAKIRILESEPDEAAAPSAAARVRGFRVLA